MEWPRGRYSYKKEVMAGQEMLVGDARRKRKTANVEERGGRDRIGPETRLIR